MRLTIFFFIILDNSVLVKRYNHLNEFKGEQVGRTFVQEMYSEVKLGRVKKNYFVSSLVRITLQLRHNKWFLHWILVVILRTSKTWCWIWYCVITIYNWLWKSTWWYTAGTDRSAVWLYPQIEYINTILKYWDILCITAVFPKVYT